MNLENFKVEELSAQEKRETEGGIWGALIFLAMCIIGYRFATDGNSNTVLRIDGEQVGN